MRFAATTCLVWSAIFLSAAPASQAAEPTIWKVEEDWEMAIFEPEPVNNSPQVTFSMSPIAGLQDLYFELQMNYAADTDYSEGGFRVAAIKQDSIVDESRSATQQPLAVDGDRVRWTSVMAVIGNEVLFAVKDGYCQHWGSFGGPEYLVRLRHNAALDLGSYDPQTSLDLVDIGFGANRISSITLVQVTLSYTDGSTVVVPVNRTP